MSDLDLGQTLRVEGVDMDLKTDFWFCPKHGVFVPRLFDPEFIDEHGCPVPAGDSYGESTCGQTIKHINMAEWDRATVRVEVNRKTFELPRKAVSVKAFREFVGIPDDEALWAKGDPHPGELGGEGSHLLPIGQLFEPRDGMEFYSVAKDRTTIFSGIPITFDSDLGPNQIKLAGGPVTRIFELTDDDHLVEVTI